MKFNTKKEQKIVTNFAGGKAIPLDKKTELVFAVLATFLKDEYYESGSERANRITELVKQTDPEFVAKLAKVARHDFHLRSVSHLLTGVLAKIHNGDNLIARTLDNVVERPDDLLEIAAVLGVDNLTNQFKKGFRHAILKFNRYNLAKYRGEGKEIKLVDLFNLCHPSDRFATPEQRIAWGDLMENKLKNEETWETMKSSGKGTDETFYKLMLEDKLGYMAALRNLRNIEQGGKQETIKMVCDLISNPDKVRYSKQLPFRFLTAYEQVSDRRILKALGEALELSLKNVPTFPGKTLIGIDVSGSMHGNPLQIASAFAAALYKYNNADVMLYSDHIISGVRLNPADSLTTISSEITSHLGGGTQTSLVFEYAVKSGVKYDRIIILSDNESWIENNWNTGVNNIVGQAKRLLNNPKIYCIDIQGYGTFDISANNSYHITGWSEKVFDLIKILEDGGKIFDYINSQDLKFNSYAK